MLQAGTHTGGTERAPYVSAGASASPSSQPQLLSPILPQFLLHKQNSKNPLLQLMMPLGISKQGESTGRVSRFDIFFKLITFDLHMKLFIAISTLNEVL